MTDRLAPSVASFFGREKTWDHAGTWHQAPWRAIRHIWSRHNAMTARQIWPADACPNMNATPLLTTSCARPEVGLEPQDTLVGDGAGLSCFVPMMVLAADARGEECGAAAVFFLSFHSCSRTMSGVRSTENTILFPVSAAPTISCDGRDGFFLFTTAHVSGLPFIAIIRRGRQNVLL